MKILLAIDDSPYSEQVVETILARHWPTSAEFKILVVLESMEGVKEEEHLAHALDSYAAAQEKRHHAAEHLADKVRKKMHGAIKGVSVHCLVKKGQPADEILSVAHEWGADTIILGAHGKDVCPHNLLGSVSHAVAKNANCTVEIVRPEEHRLKVIGETRLAHASKQAHSGKKG